jgi:hypothetical protein
VSDGGRPAHERPPARALIVPVPPTFGDGLALPPGAVPLRDEAGPALHVTLLSRHTLAPIEEALRARWAALAPTLPPPPRPAPDGPVRRAHDPARGQTSWYVVLAEQAAWRAHVAAVVAAIDAALRRDGLGGFAASEPDRVFHVTLANDQGGDPHRSIAAPWAFERAAGGGGPGPG